MRFCISSYRRAITCVVAFLLAGFFVGRGFADGIEKSSYTISDASLRQVRANGVVVSDGYFYVYAEAKPRTQSSGSVSMAHNQAELAAKSQLIRKLFTDGIQPQLKQIPEKYRQSISEILARNYETSRNLSGFITARSGVESGMAWVVLVGPVDGIIQGKQEMLRDMMQQIIASKTKRITAEEADVFFEVSHALGFAQAKSYWLLCQPELLRPQLMGSPVDQALRWWARNEDAVLAMGPEDLSVADMKNCMILLPYSRKMNDNLIARYAREGMSQCADAIRLTGFVCGGTTDEILKNINSSAFQDAVRAGESGRALIRVILASNGQMPATEEAAGDLYAQALSEYTTNTVDNARSLGFQALEQSVNADTLNLYGAVMRRLGYCELGAVLCRQAYTCRPNHPYALINEALCMEALKKQVEARRLATLALQNGGLDAWGRAEAARIGNGK
jgi:hypothetical protein